MRDIQNRLPSSRVLAAALVLFATSSHAFANSPYGKFDSKQQAAAFSHIYATFCIKHIMDLKKLSDGMALSPKLSKEQAAPYLQGKPGVVWPVPHPAGSYVLAIRSDENVCMVYGRKADPATVERTFEATATSPKSSLTTKQVQNVQLQTSHGPAHTMTYTWSMPNDPRKIVLSLTTSASDTTPAQAVATAAHISR